MSRALLFPLTMMLLIATAIAMLASAMLLPMAALPEGSGPDGTGVVERFYAAVNETIATGNPEPVQRVVNPAFADENPLPGVKPGRDGLEAYLVGLHDTDPALRLEADVISASPSQVVARVQVRRASSAAAAPPALQQQRVVWSPVEVFGIADGVIVKRWGQTDGLLLARPLAAQTIEMPTPTPHVVSLMRMTLEPGTRWNVPRGAAPRFLYLQTGVIKIQAAPGSAWDDRQDHKSTSLASQVARANATQRAVLATGTSWLAQPWSHVSATNTGTGDAQLLAVTFAEPQLPAKGAPTVTYLPPGVTTEVLAGDLATFLGSGPVEITLEQIACAPEAGLNFASTQGPLLVAVESGQLEATAWGEAWVRRRRDGVSQASQAITLSQDNGLLVQKGGMVALRNDAQEVAYALVVTVQAVDADGEP